MGCFTEAHTMSIHVRPNFDSLPNSAFLLQEEIIPLILPISRMTFWRLIIGNHFPRPTRMAPNMPMWKVGTVREWLRQREAA